ncbi:MAG: acetoin utilization protein AcuB [Chlamydiales bacterium]|jgi:acetoin utilization protein AcuB
MTFYIYDPQGSSVPYESQEEWRKVEKTQEIEHTEEFINELKKRKKKKKSVKKKKALVDELPLDPYKGKKESPIVASQIMSTNIVTLRPEDTLAKAWQLIDAKRFRHIPILSKGKLVGILSDRGLVHELFEIRDHILQGTIAEHVCDVMVTNVLTSRPNTEISYIAQIFIEEQIGAMPIIDANDKLVGILTRSDILRTLVKIHPRELRI